MLRVLVALGLACFVLAMVGRTDDAVQATAPARFSTMNAESFPAPWRIVTLRGEAPAEFTLTDDERETVVQADASGSVAALWYDVDGDTESSVISWRWKIAKLLERSDISTRDGDDFPARVYVTFDYDRRRLPFFTRMQLGIARLFYSTEIPTAALCYVWDTSAPVGTVTPNAWTERVRMVVLRSGLDGVGEWTTERRNFREDFRQAFGEEAPPVNGVAIAIDTDNTGETARAWFGDIELLRDGPP